MRCIIIKMIIIAIVIVIMIIMILIIIIIILLLIMMMMIMMMVQAPTLESMFVPSLSRASHTPPRSWPYIDIISRRTSPGYAALL